MKKYLSLIGFSALILIVGWLGYQSLFAYLSNHTYYFGILSLGDNRWIFISALICAGLFPIFYLFTSSKLKISRLIMRFIIGAGIFGLIHSNIKGDPVGPGQLITIFNTMLLVSLGVYLILGFSALGNWIERKLVRFSQFRWQEIFLTFGIGFCSFVILVQILLGIGVLYGIVSWILFLGLGFMIRYERHQLGKWGEIIGDILNDYKEGIIFGEWNLNSKNFWGGKKIGYLVLSLPLLLSLAYLYMGIQNAFVPYSTAWDANHEYMYTPKILAENAGVYRGNNYTASTMPGFWHQFLTFIFSLTGYTNGWFGLSPDNIAISMNNISAFLVLIFGIAIIFQVFTLINDKKENKEKKSELKKGKNAIIETGVLNGSGITIGWYFLLLWLTGGMGAFLVIVDNKTDLGVMALSLLALLAGLIFLQNRKTSNNKSELFKYILITGLFFGFAALAKITAFVDLVLFGLLLVGLRFSSLTSLGLGIMVMGLVRKFSILTSFLMISDMSATWMIIIGGTFFVLGLVVYVLKLKCKDFWKNFKDLLILGIGFLIPLIMLKLPRAIIGQINNNNFSFSSSLKAVFLSMGTENKKGNENYKFLAQNENIDEIGDGDVASDTNLMSSVDQQNEIDGVVLGSKKYWNFEQCISAGDIYSDEELGESMQETLAKTEDLGRYVGYGWKEFKKANMFSIDDETAGKNWFKFLKVMRPKSDACSEPSSNNSICEKNLMFGLMKILWPTSNTCYGFNHDAKVLCNNADVIDSFKINDLRGIYENGIKNQNGEAGILLKNAIDTYDKAEFEGKIGSSSNTDLFHEEIVNLRQYYQSHSILSTEDSINIPYRYLVPLNISFNWSLQNLSSYYTDIGYFWIVVYIFLLIALPYAIVKKDKLLTSVTLITLIGWGIRWIIGSAILWYGTVLICWSMITLTILWDKLLQKNDNENPKILPQILVILVGIFFGIQIIFNYLRIASQGANSVFVWYKGNIGNEQIIDDQLQQNLKIKYGYTWKNIFNLQFPQYNPIIHALANRDKNDGVTVAGTYIQYFLGNQRNVKQDGMLSNFRDKTYRKKSSNLDLCKTYWRLKNENTRYFIIDPNIGTVSMGEGNETLFYRFFAKLGANNTKIITDGAITTFIRFYTLGYLKLVSTNNIGTKYAFTLDDDTIRKYFGESLTDEELVLTRGKMAVLQYFDDANSIFSTIAEIFVSRIMNDTKAGVEDIANIYGYEVDSNAVAKVADKYIKSKVTEGINELTQNERTVLITYINLYLGYQHGGENEISSMVQNILLNSVTGGSQVFALELN